MFVSVPGTIVIFTQMSGFAWLNDSTILAIVSEAGGVCSVQNLTSVAPAWQVAPVTVDSSGPLAAADSPALAAGLPLAPGLAALGAHAPTARTIATVNTKGDRRRDPLMSPPCRTRTFGAARSGEPSAKMVGGVPPHARRMRGGRSVLVASWPRGTRVARKETLRRDCIRKPHRSASLGEARPLRAVCVDPVRRPFQTSSARLPSTAARRFRSRPD